MKERTKRRELPPLSYGKPSARRGGNGAPSMRLLGCPPSLKPRRPPSHQECSPNLPIAFARSQKCSTPPLASRRTRTGGRMASHPNPLHLDADLSSDALSLSTKSRHCPKSKILIKSNLAWLRHAFLPLSTLACTTLNLHWLRGEAGLANYLLPRRNMPGLPNGENSLFSHNFHLASKEPCSRATRALSFSRSYTFHLSAAAPDCHST